MKNFLHKIRYLSGMLLVLLLPLSGAVLAQTQKATAAAAAIGIRIVGAKTLNVRSNPSVGNNIIGHFNKGDHVNVKEKDKTGNWCHVDYQNRNDAWVYCKGLMKEKTGTKPLSKPFGQTYRMPEATPVTPAPTAISPAPEDNCENQTPNNPLGRMFRQTAKPTTGTVGLPALTSDVSQWREAGINGLTFRYPPELSFITGPTNKHGTHYYVMNVTPRHLYLKITVKPAGVYDCMVKKFNQSKMMIQSGNVNVGNVTGLKFVHSKTVGKNSPRVMILAKNKKNTYVIDNMGNDPDLLNKFLSTFNVQS